MTNETLGMMVVVADVKIAGVWGGEGGAGRTDESFVFLLIDADFLSCLLLPHFAELYPANWHVPSLRYTARH